jgi:hypothetical protein
MSEIDVALESIENYRAWLDSLPEVDEDNMYCIDIVTEDETHRHGLLLARNRGEAIEQFDITFLQHHNEKQYGDALYMTLVAPVDADGFKQELARIDLA